MPNATPRAKARTLPESDAALVAFSAELTACDALKSMADEEDDNEQFEALYYQHWALREKINRIAATTVHGLRAKARAADFALKWDDDLGNRGDGSFFDLIRSITWDIAVMAANETNHPAAHDEIKRAVEARRRNLEAALTLAKSDAKRDRIASDVAACESLLRKLAASEEART